MRADATLVPFAAIVDGQWRSAWPEGAAADQPAEADMDALPSVWRELGTGVPRDWQASLFDGRSTAVRARTARWTESHCESLPVLTSDLPAAPVEPHTFPLEIVGIASRGATIQIDPVVAVRKTDARYGAAERAVDDAFDALERREFERQRTLIPLEPLPSAFERPRLQEMYAARGISTSYIVAAKKYATGPPEGRLTVIAGWVTGREGLVGGSVFFTDQDRKDVVTERPLAVVFDGRSRVWLAQTIGYESEAYGLLSVDSSGARPLLGFHVGAC